MFSWGKVERCDSEIVGVDRSLCFVGSGDGVVVVRESCDGLAC